MSGAEPVIRVRGLRTQFDTHVVHDGLDLDLYRGEILGVVGGSGTGKSVLLRAIVGLITPAAGQVEVLGRPTSGAGMAQATGDGPTLEQQWGVMFQDGALFSALTVRENVELPLRAVPGLTDAERRGLAELKVSMAGLPWKANGNYPSELSGGMRKRAGLARALALDPQILFLDEPTAGLDPIGASAFDRLIVTLRDALDLSVFLVTHDLDTLHACCDRVAVLADRHVLTTGTMKDMLAVDHPWVHEYFHGPRARAATQGAATAAKKD